MEIFAETVFAIGFGMLCLVHLVSVVGSFRFDFIEMIKIFFIPGYAIMIAWREHTWLKWGLIGGGAIALIGLVLLEFV